MKKKTCILFSIMIGIFAACQKDPLEIPVDKVGVNWVGKWNRDSVLLNEIAANGTKTRTESLVNDGVFTFNSDSISGILSQGTDDFAITWAYDFANDKITISEPDWIKQVYSIKQISTNNIMLTGTKTNRSGTKNERILYLRKK